MRGSLWGDVKGCLEEVCFRCCLNVEQVWESQKAFSREFQTVGAHTQTAQELKTSFVRGRVRRLTEMEQRSLDGAYGIRRSDKYDGVLVDKILCVSVANLYIMRHFTGSH